MILCMKKSDRCIAQHTLNVLLHYLVKWQLSQRHFHIKTIHSSSVVTNKCHFMTKSNASYKDCSKCPAFAWTRVWSCENHGSIASSMRLCSRLSHVWTRTLLQIVNASHLRPINMVLHCTTHLVVNRVEVGATDLEQWKPEPLAAVTLPSHGPYWLVGALTCWKMKKSPDIAQISGSISCFSSTSQ